MAYTAPTVNYYDSGTSSWLTMSGVQSVNIRRGKQRFQDPFTQTAAEIEIIPTVATTFNVGQMIDVRDTNADAANCYFQGQITDVQRSYDMPYNSGTGATPGDRIRVTATGGTGLVGTAQLSGQTWISASCAAIIESLLTAQNLQVGSTWSNNVQASGQTFSGALLDAVNQLLRTSQMIIDDYAVARALNKLGFTYYPTGQAFNTISFTDTGSGYGYSGLEFLSSVQNTFNWIELTATGVYNVVAAFGAAPFNALTYSTFNATPADASSLASYLWYLLSGQVAPAPFSISTSTMVSAGCMALAQIPASTLGNAVIGQQVGVTFRGSTTYGSVVGVNAAFYPDHGSVQLFLSPSLGTPFTLDSVAYGVLDQNRLGYP